MRIDDKNMTGIGASGPLGTQSARELERSHGGSIGSARHASLDRVQLSGLAEQLRALQPDSEARQAEVERLKTLVESGRYQVDAGRVSNALVEEALQDTQTEAVQHERAAR